MSPLLVHILWSGVIGIIIWFVMTVIPLTKPYASVAGVLAFMLALLGLFGV